MDNNELCQHTRIRLIAAAIGHQQCTKTAANVIPLPGTDRFIAIGTAAEVARLLEIAPRDTCAEMRELCSSCGGTGDVHSLDGEWRGECNCPAGISLTLERLKTAAKKTMIENEELRAALARAPLPAQAAPATSDLVTVDCPVCSVGDACDECHGQGKLIVSRADMAAAGIDHDHSEGGHHD